MKKYLIMLIVATVCITNATQTSENLPTSDYETAYENSMQRFHFPPEDRNERDGYRITESLRLITMDENEDYENMFHHTYEYSTEEEISTGIYHNWDIENQEWYISGKYEYSYLNGEISEIMHYSYTNETWVQIHKMTRTFDVDMNVLSQLTMSYNNNQWINSTRELYEYEDGNRIQRTFEMYEDDEWLYYYRMLYTYQIDFLITETQEDYFDGVWYPFYTKTYTYENDLISEILAVYGSGIEISEEYSYNEYDMLIQILIQQWENENWENVERTTKEYDANMWLVRDFTEQFINNEWMIYRDEEMVNDEHGNETEKIITVWDEGVFNFSQIIYKTYEAYADAEQEYVVAKKLSIYPNPFNPVTTISFDLSRSEYDNAEVIIYNAKGQKVTTLPVDIPGTGTSVSWNAEGHSSGVYFVKLVTDGKAAATKKMLLLK